MLSILGDRGIRGRGVHCGNVQVTNNAKCFLLQKANLPICIYNGRSYYRAPAKKCAVGSPMNPRYGDLVWLILCLKYNVNWQYMPLFYFYRSVYSSIWLSNWVVNCERNSWLCRWFSVAFRELVFLCQCDGSISCCTHFEWALCFSFMATLSRSVTFLFKLCPF